MLFRKTSLNMKEALLYFLILFTLINNCNREKSMGKISTIETEQEAIMASVWYLKNNISEEHLEVGMIFKKVGSTYSVNWNDGFDIGQLKEKAMNCENHICRVTDNMGKVNFIFQFKDNRTIEILENNIRISGEGGGFGFFKRGTILVRIDPKKGSFLDYDDYIESHSAHSK